MSDVRNFENDIVEYLYSKARSFMRANNCHENYVLQKVRNAFAIFSLGVSNPFEEDVEAINSGFKRIADKFSEKWGIKHERL